MKPLPITLDFLLREYESAHDEAGVAQRMYQISRSSRHCSLWLDALRSAQSAQDALIEGLATEAGDAEILELSLSETRKVASAPSAIRVS